MTNRDRRSDSLAAWIRQTDLADQIFITGTTLILEDIRLRRSDLPFPIDERALRESDPQTAYRLARCLSDAYAQFSDGVDGYPRISGLANELANRIAKYHPEAA